jgi:hypothetical protein
MAQTKQITFTAEGQQVQIKARRMSNLRYRVEVNGNKYVFRPDMSLFEATGDYPSQALDQVIEKGLAKWLKESAPR